MFCISGETSCGLPGGFRYEGWYFWYGEETMGDFGFLIESDACRVSLCFRSLYITDILWNYIWAILWSLWLALLLLNLDTLLTPCANVLIWFHAHYPFHWHTWRLGVNTLGVALFRMPLSPHHNLTASITCYNCYKR